jgi:fimbrial chaperone protein
MKTPIVYAVAALAVQMLAASPASAYQLNPMSQVFSPSGSGATQSFEIVNDGKGRIAIEVSMTSLERDESYVEINRDAGDDFLVYPPQIIIPAGGRQMVRVTWLGDPSPRVERAYRLVATQLPIELLDPAAKAPPLAVGQMRVLVTYKASVFIRPRLAAAKLALGAVDVAKGEGGANVLALTVENSGTGGAVIASCAVRLTSAGTTIALSDAGVAKSRVPAGARRRYLLPWPAGLPVGPVTAEGDCRAKP